MVKKTRSARISQAAIFAAAAEEFAERGFDAAGVDRIASRARVNKAMLYYHFGSKRELYLDLVRDMVRTVGSRARGIADGAGSAEDKLDAWIAAIVEEAAARPWFASIMLREVAEGGAHLDRATLAELSAVPQAFGEVIAAGIRSGALRAVHPMAAYFTILAPIIFYLASAPIRDELAEARLLKLSPLPADVFITHLRDTMRRALVVDAGKPARST